MHICTTWILGSDTRGVKLLETHLLLAPDTPVPESEQHRMFLWIALVVLICLSIECLCVCVWACVCLPGLNRMCMHAWSQFVSKYLYRYKNMYFKWKINSLAIKYVSNFVWTRWKGYLTWLIIWNSRIRFGFHFLSLECALICIVLYILIYLNTKRYVWYVKWLLH